MDEIVVPDVKAIKQYCKNPNMKYYRTYQKEREIKTVLSGNGNGKKCVTYFSFTFALSVAHS